MIQICHNLFSVFLNNSQTISFNGPIVFDVTNNNVFHDFVENSDDNGLLTTDTSLYTDRSNVVEPSAMLANHYDNIDGPDDATTAESSSVAAGSGFRTLYMLGFDRTELMNMRSVLTANAKDNPVSRMTSMPEAGSEDKDDSETNSYGHGC